MSPSRQAHRQDSAEGQERRAQQEAARVVAAAAIDVDSIEYPAVLPISERRADLVAAIRDNQVVIVAGETGSGKSTQLPKLCLEAGRGVGGMIGHTQPRRIAARTVAERIAEELGDTIGEAVGYTVRFNDRVSDGTLVRVMTDGILLNELQRDRLLMRYDTLIIDEAHERSLNIDFILGYLKQLLPKRPDLKVIVTSATIDTDRFAQHFCGAEGEPAPVLTVEGRTYPVEMRYRPYGAQNEDEPNDSRDQVTAVIDAIDELASSGEGDVLVFLSGEREIHDVADALRRSDGSELEVLPLYARLSSSEQHRIFKPHRKRRVVLSTNVAETSITVPGVRYVVDAGTARISRYSRRLKVQRLPIESISQASANQRAGRCGRVAPGVCIRLYSEVDYEARQEFTEPEILRTSLASVILQMTSIGLGDVSRFPFIERPDPSSIRDGYQLLDELGALAQGPIGSVRKLTKTGKSLARLPIDPRLARMVIEAQRQDCVREVLIVASALSIRDVRERPKESAEKAAELHRRFDVEGSDLLSIVKLWDHLRRQQQELSGNRFRRMCRDEYLNYLRVREWRDLYSQLRQVAGQLKIRPTFDEADPDKVHKAILAGLLSHIGERDGSTREFRGARDARFMVAPGSVLTRRPPHWIMAGELVETNRLWARRVAAIEPEWAESIGSHLVKRSYGEPWWDEEAGRAVVAETVTLYGVPIVVGRTIGLDKADVRLAREMFIRHALVAGAWRTRHDFVGRNDEFVGRVALLEARVRRDDLLDDEGLYEFYDARVDGAVVSTRHFDRWWKHARLDDPALLDLGAAVLTNRRGISLLDYPSVWGQGEIEYPLTYRFEPGTPLDGATINIDLATLNQVDDAGFDWGIPGYRRELVAMLTRSLPKEIRRHLVPMNDTIAAAYSRLAQHGESLCASLAEAISTVSGVKVEASNFDVSDLPSHLRLHMVVLDDVGQVVDAGDDLVAIRDRQAGSTRSAIAKMSTVEERRDIVTWDMGDIERVVEHRSDGGNIVRAYPALLDRGDSVALRVVDNEALQARAMEGGVRRLLLMIAAPTATRVLRSLDPDSKLAIAGTDVSIGHLATESIEASVDSVMHRYDLPWGSSAFDTIETAVREDCFPIACDVFAVAVDVLAAAERVRKRTNSLRAEALLPTVSDSDAHLSRLVPHGFVRSAGAARLPDVHRYVRGIEYRLDHLDGDVGRDQRRMAEVRPVERAYFAAVSKFDYVPPKVRGVAWSIEEFRMSLFAQPLGVAGPISQKRIRFEFANAAGCSLDIE